MPNDVVLVGVNNGTIVSVNPTTNAFTQVGTAEIPGNGGQIEGAEAAVNGTLYVTADGSSGLAFYAVNLNNGTVVTSTPSSTTIAENFVSDDLSGLLVGVQNDLIVEVDKVRAVLKQSARSEAAFKASTLQPRPP